MFGDLFGGLLGVVAPVGKTVEERGKYYFLLKKLDHLVGVYLGVEMDGPDDVHVHGRPVVTVIYTPDVRREEEKKIRMAEYKVQQVFVTLVREVQPDVPVESRYFGHEPKPENAWNALMPSHKRGLDWPCNNIKCPARGEKRGLGAFGLEPVPREDFLDTFCVPHREMVDAYLAEHPDAWPPGDVQDD